MSLYFDRQGNPITMEAWAAAFADNKVRLTKVSDSVEVSTVWMGIDHSFGSGPPVIFESMVFGGPLDEECRRYCTEAEAIVGHELLVTEARARGAR